MWYESSLIATIIGTLLGFALAFVPAWIRKHSENRSLRALLDGEIERIVEYCRLRKPVYSRYRDLVASGGALGVYYSDRDMDAVFSSNRGALQHLDRTYAKRIAGFYAHVADFKARASVLGESLRAHHAGEDLLTDTEFFIGSLEKLNDTLSAIVKEGDEILGNDTK